MKYFRLLLLFIFCAPAIRAQQLVKDINNIITAGYKQSLITTVVSAGPYTYFIADDGSSGKEPWVTDGTPAGTHLLRDINPGKVSSMLTPSFTYSNGYVYFVAEDGTHGFELWKSDGTAAGTVMVKDISTGIRGTGNNGSTPRNLCDVNGVLHFVARSSAASADYHIWKTDGTEAGTVKAAASPVEATGTELCNVNGMLYFRSGTTGLSRINGSTAEVVHATINAGKLTAIGSTLYFTGTNASNGNELWKAEGAAATMIKDINPGTVSSNPTLLTDVSGTLFFTATDGVNGKELWKSDGTEAGTVMVKDITSSNNDSSVKPTLLIAVNDKLFFRGNGGAAGYELWASDGTAAGTGMVKDITVGAGTSLTNMVNNNGVLFFRPDESRLWRSDGTELGTVQVKYMSDGLLYVTPVAGTPGTVVFYGSDNPFNLELWKSDGSEAGTTLLKNIANDNPHSLYTNNVPVVPERFAHSNGQLYFGVRNVDLNRNYSLYNTSGTEASTVKLNEQLTDNLYAFPSDAVNASGSIYFGFTGPEGNELWKSDGTISGTAMLKDINPGFAGSVPSYMHNHNGTVYFAANNGPNGVELWKTNGTTAGTVMVKDIRPGGPNSSSLPSQFTSYNGLVYFTANNGTNGIELWKTDGTDAGTVMVKDIAAGTASSLNDVNLGEANYLTVAGNQLFFAANNVINGTELWKTDGTEAGTVLVKDMTPVSGYNSNVHFFKAVGNKLFFVANSGTNINEDAELWVSDGTATGTVLVKDINPGLDPSSPSNLVNLDGTLFFSAYEPATGFELWKSDGTEAGTVLVKDIAPGTFSGMQAGHIAGVDNVELSNMAGVNGTLYFSATTAANGREPWKSDGTAAGTSMISDLFPGPQSSDPEQFTRANGDMYFVAENGTNGKELFIIQSSSNFILPPVSVEDSTDVNWQNNALVSGTNQVIATVMQTGAHPVNGFVHTKLSVGGAAILYNGRTLAGKHVDIEPANDPATSTATITLYFSQADFDAYNAADNINGDLPTSPSDILGKDVVRIMQFHGVGTAPGNYSGEAVLIDPGNDSIVWNAAGNYWEVSFAVNGFSGFYLTSADAGPLPVSLIEFTGELTARQDVLLTWKVEQQQGIVRYAVQRSATGNDFATIGNVDGNTQNQFVYHHTDGSPLAGRAFYRIQITDVDGSITYSNIIEVTVARSGSITLGPVPAQHFITVQVNNARYLQTKAALIDNAGRVLQRFTIHSVRQRVDVSRLPAGMYYIQLDDGSAFKFLK